MGCNHNLQAPDRFYSLCWKNRKAGKKSPVVGVYGSVNYKGEFPIRCAAMGIDWMINRELVKAIPPAYTQWIGEQLIADGAKLRAQAYDPPPEPVRVAPREPMRNSREGGGNDYNFRARHQGPRQRGIRLETRHLPNNFRRAARCPDRVGPVGSVFLS